MNLLTTPIVAKGRSTLDNAEPFLLGAAATVGVSREERDRAVAVS